MKEKRNILFLAIVFFLLLIFGFYISSDEKEDLVEDSEGNVYETIQLGEQIWLAENLKTAQHSEGESWCYKEKEENCEVYGRLYDLEAAMVACPEGWILPSDEDWKELENYIDDEEMLGAKLKSLPLWDVRDDTEEKIKNLDEYGLNFLPGGHYVEGYFYDQGRGAFLWSSTQQNNGSTWSRSLLNSSNEFVRSLFTPEHAFSVRCLKGVSSDDET